MGPVCQGSTGGSTSASGRSLAKWWFRHRLQVWSRGWSTSRLTLERRSPKTVASSGSVEPLPFLPPHTQHRGGRAPPLDACRWWSRVGGGPRRRDLRGGGGRPRQPEPQRGCGPGDPPSPPEQDEEAEDAVTPRPTRGAGRIGRRRWPAAARSARPVGSRSDGGGGGFGRLGRRRATG